MIQKFPARMIESEWLTVCEWSHIGPWERPPRSHQSSACLLPGGRNGEDKGQLPSANCYNWVIKTDDVKWKPVFYWMSVHLAFIHTRRHDCDSPAPWPWALCSASVFAPQQSLVKDRVMTVSQKGCFCTQCKIKTNWIIRWVDLPLSFLCWMPFCDGSTFA